MSHFSDEAWFDLVRRLLPPEETAVMTRHLDEGCEECKRLHDLWRKVEAIASRESLYEPENSDLRIAKAAYAAELPTLAMPKNARRAAVVFDSFRDPAPVGFRGTAIQTRLLVCRAKGWNIALRLTQEPGNGISIGGQITQSTKVSQAGNGRTGPFEVTVAQVDKFVDRVETNGVGEFYVRCPKEINIRLYVHVSEKDTLEIRLPGLSK
jgi:hypothetical protein